MVSSVPGNPSGKFYLVLYYSLLLCAKVWVMCIIHIRKLLKQEVDSKGQKTNWGIQVRFETDSRLPCFSKINLKSANQKNSHS